MTYALSALLVFLTVIFTYPTFIIVSFLMGFFNDWFDEALGEGGIELMVAIVVVSIIPNLIKGGAAGGVALWVVGKKCSQADISKIVVISSIAMAAYAFAGPFFFPLASHLSNMVMVTGAILAYLFVAPSFDAFDEAAATWVRLARLAMMVLIIAECGLIPVLGIRPMEPNDELPVFQPINH